MTTPARLLALRLQGFKSFAERTTVEFGPGISAVVGPNGSGKSNLADALRWALGEQGRALRSRRSEDVIFAGSERRPALGMADVTIVLDNADRLLPVEYSVVELGRRLYRSGENDYLLNRQRVRLRDLVDLLDAAVLADNAFLFIGQGMVDQALALRPEERRPLFEEVAGVRRHERRRRKAEEQLIEAEGNLARVGDIVAELRPQARRLSVQAEQQATRASAGDELAGALVVAAHARWHEASNGHAVASQRLGATRHESDLAMNDLSEAEGVVAGISASLAVRAEDVDVRLQRYEVRRAEATALRLRSERLESDLAAVERERSRVTGERQAADAELSRRRAELAVPPPERDLDLEAAAAESERVLAEALAERDAHADGADQAQRDVALTERRLDAVNAREVESAHRRLDQAVRLAADQRARTDAGVARRTDLSERLKAARRAVADAAEAERLAGARRDEARAGLDEAGARQRLADERLAGLDGQASAARTRLDTLRARLADGERRGIARAVRPLGGRRVDEQLQVDPALRAAVEAALGPLARAYLVAADDLAKISAGRGVVLVEGADAELDVAAAPVRPEARVADRRAPDDLETGGPPARLRVRLAGLGGGFLVDAVRRDGVGAARELLARAAWVPDRQSVLDLRAELPDGWLLVSRDGATLATRRSITFGRGETPLEERAEVERLAGDLERHEEAQAEAMRTAADAARVVESARSVLETARLDESRALSARRATEEAERAADRGAEAAGREASWQLGQAERAESDVARLRDAVESLERELAQQAPTTDGKDPMGTSSKPRVRAAMERRKLRLAELRARRDRLSAQLAEHDRRRRDAEAQLARAGAAVDFAEGRIAEADAEEQRMAHRAIELAADRERLAGELAVASAREEAERAGTVELRAADAEDRRRLIVAEAAVTAARERMRTASDRLRAAEGADLEARLGLDSIREQILVELAGLGDAGTRALAASGGPPGSNPGGDRSVADRLAASAREPFDDDSELAELEAILPLVLPVWTAGPPGGELPTAGRISALRRRFHELGEANPFAIEEYAEIRARLESLDGQASDLRAAIDRTRHLIDELATLISEQFRSTFRALEVAFDARFRQLFGGGFARLELTDPADLSATGVEIVARPPGKKAQPLAMLSGGERALTAVALLFAMLEVRPVPFCVLDEVDAALDEANVGRFTEALRSLAEGIQFVVITHNRGTIESADALYGVTVGDDSVSRIISLRLDEATAIAARREEAGGPIVPAPISPAPIAG